VAPYVQWEQQEATDSVRAVIVPHDWKKSPAWDKYVQDEKAVVLGFYYDSIPAFRGLKMSVHSTAYVVMEILNLPFYLRADPRFTMLCSIIPGPKKPRNSAPWLVPVCEDLARSNITVLFASADYEAHVSLLSHKSLGYVGCTKCEKRSVRFRHFYDWGDDRKQPLPRLKTGRSAVLYGRDARVHRMDHRHGFKKEPIVAKLLDDCILQSPEDALHLVEGCLKMHLFRLLAGKKDVAQPGPGGRWARWLGELDRIAMTPAARNVLDQRWRTFCQLTGRSCTATPFASSGSMTGEDWYVLALCGEWIFDGLIPNAALLEYCVTLCTIFRLLGATTITPKLLDILTRLEQRFQFLHLAVMPPIARPLVFHRIGHMIRDVRNFGPMLLWWCFRNERFIGQITRTLRRRCDIESHVEANIVRNKLGRGLVGTQAVAQEDLEWLQSLEPLAADEGEDALRNDARRLHLSSLAGTILERRERKGTRLNLVRFPEGSPLGFSGWRLALQDERDAARYSIFRVTSPH